MPVYDYKGLTASGGVKNGILDADSPREARLKLRSQNVLVTAIHARAQSIKRDASKRKILDFKRATELFADKDFDGDPVQIYEPKGDDPIAPPEPDDPAQPVSPEFGDGQPADNRPVPAKAHDHHGPGNGGDEKRRDLRLGHPRQRPASNRSGLPERTVRAPEKADIPGQEEAQEWHLAQHLSTNI